MMGAIPYFPRLHYYRAANADCFIAASTRAADLFRALGDEQRLSRALGLAAMHLVLAGRRSEAAHVAEDGLRTARASANQKIVAAALYAKSFAVSEGSTAERIGLLTEALDLCRDRSPFTKAVVLFALGEVAFESGEALEALAYAQRGVLAWDGTPPSVNQAQIQINIAAYLLALGRPGEAHLSAGAALTVAHRIGDPMIAGACFLHFAGVAAAAGDAQRAARLLGASSACRGPDQPRLFTEQTGYIRTLQHLRPALSREELERLVREGYGWSIDDAIEQTSQTSIA
jgi:tetratricopeptide (TPR) repeat protein